MFILGDKSKAVEENRMGRKGKVAFGITTVILAFISSAIGLWLLSEVNYDFSTRFIMRFFLIFTPVFTILSVINFLKKGQ